MKSKLPIFMINTRAALALLAAYLVLSSVPAWAQSYEVPRRGQWVAGPHLSRRDLSDDAITSGTFSLGATNSVATVYVACKGVERGTPVLELRASVPVFAGSATVLHQAQVTVGDHVRSGPLDVIPLSSQVIFVVELDAGQIATLGKDNSDDLGGLSIGFRAADRQGLVSADLPSRNKALDPVLNSCRASDSMQSTSAGPPGVANRAGIAPTSASQSRTTWRLNKIDGGNEVLLAGTVEANGRRHGAILQFSCKVKQFANSKYPMADAGVELRVPLAIIDFDYSDITMQGGGADFGRSKIGDQPEIHVGMSADQVPDKTVATNRDATAPFNLDYSEPDLRQIVQNPGKTLQVVMHPPKTGKDAAAAIFQLPADASPLRSTMEPCLGLIEEHERRVRALDLVSCPALAAKTLLKADVLVGSAGNPLAWTQDSETPNWTLPSVSKARPVRPKLALACYYGPAGYVEKTNKIPERQLLPIPAAATYCSYTSEATEGRSHAECSHSIPALY